MLKKIDNPFSTVNDMEGLTFANKIDNIMRKIINDGFVKYMHFKTRHHYGCAGKHEFILKYQDMLIGVHKDVCFLVFDDKNGRDLFNPSYNYDSIIFWKPPYSEVIEFSTEVQKYLKKNYKAIIAEQKKINVDMKFNDMASRIPNNLEK